jgi:mannose-6-phosphate isomerase-like protein (cupin superfamily)
MTTPVRPFVVTAEDGESFPGPAGGMCRVIARTETTAGAFGAVENVVAAGQGPPLHMHRAEDEMFYVLAGGLRFRAGDEEFDVRTGAFVFVPRGTPHIFINPGPDPTRLLVMFNPAGLERFYENQAKLPPGPRDPVALQAIAQQASMDILGPPTAPGA